MQLYNKKTTLCILGLSILTWLSCNPEIEQPVFSKGDADFSRLITVGNSLTAGIESNGLTHYFQEASYPNILAEQFKKVGGGEFNQPWVPEGSGSGPLQITAIANDNCGNPSPTIAAITTDSHWSDNVSSEGPFNNLGIPGISLQALDNASWASNPLNPFGTFLLRTTPTPNTTYYNYISSHIEDIKPTFFISWIGDNDALAYAATGGGYLPDLFGIKDVASPPLTPYLTSSEDFEVAYRKILDVLLANDPKGVLVTIPDVTALPYMSAVTSRFYAEGSDALLAQDPTTCQHSIPLYYKAKNSSGIVDTLAAMRGDFIILSAGNYIGSTTYAVQGLPYGLHPNNPLYNADVLDHNEVAATQQSINAYNQIIKNLGSEHNLPVADMYQELNDLAQNGLAVEGIEVNADFLTGGFFSLDGIHPTDRGYAIIANKLIDVINTHYKAHIPHADITRYPGVQFP